MQLQPPSFITSSPDPTRDSRSFAMGDYNNAATDGANAFPPRLSPPQAKATDERMSIAFLAPEQDRIVNQASCAVQLPRAQAAPTSSTTVMQPVSTAVLPPLRGLDIPGFRSIDAPAAGPQLPRIHSEDAHDDLRTRHDRWSQDQTYQQSSPSNSPESTTSVLDGNGNFRRAPRAPRPSYSEEQKFFIMFLRIVKELPWPDIEMRFDQHFGERTGPRTKGGLTSVYYRIRRTWDLEQVLETNEEAKTRDKEEVFLRANHFSPAFLNSIGYFASQN